METKILTSKQFPEIEKLKKRFKIYRATDTKGRKKLEVVELVNKDRVFRGCAKSTKKAFKLASKEIKTHYKLSA